MQISNSLPAQGPLNARGKVID